MSKASEWTRFHLLRTFDRDFVALSHLRGNLIDERWILLHVNLNQVSSLFDGKKIAYRYVKLKEIRIDLCTGISSVINLTLINIPRNNVSAPLWQHRCHFLSVYTPSDIVFQVTMTTTYSIFLSRLQGFSSDSLYHCCRLRRRHHIKSLAISSRAYKEAPVLSRTSKRKRRRREREKEEKKHADRRDWTRARHLKEFHSLV